MVIPLFDDNSDRQRIPFVNYAFIAINILFFVFLQQFGENTKFTYTYSTVPEEIVTGKDIETQPETIPTENGPRELPGLQKTPLSPYLTLITSMFMHGGLMHILGNMLFLWIFGDNIEDYLGHIRYFCFYIICGVLASLAHVLTTYLIGDNQRIPSLGASGAISGVLGGYLLLFPNRRVTVILFRFLTEVPAFIAIGLWFVFQIISSLEMFSGRSVGVAYGAHIGGFLVGLALVKVFGLGLPTPSYSGYSGRTRSRSSWR